MRTVYVVSYDITDPARWRRVYKKMRGFGDRVQYSVFRCELNPMERVLLEESLHPLIDHRKDQVLIIPLGPLGGRYDGAITALGRPQPDPERRAVVV